MSAQRRPRQRTGLVISAGVCTLAFVGLDAAPALAAAPCRPGDGLISAVTGLLCTTTGSVTTAGKNVLDRGTGGATAGVTGAVKGTADGLVGGLHGAATGAADGPAPPDGGGGGRRRDGGADDPADRSGRSREPDGSAAAGTVPHARVRDLDLRRPAPPARVPSVTRPWGAPPQGPVGTRPPEVAGGRPLLMPVRPSGDADAPAGPEGRPSPGMVAVAAGAAGAVLALHLGLVDTWRRRRRTPRR